MNLILSFLGILLSISAFSQSLENRVLVIRNTNSSVSMAVVDDYMNRRNVTKFLNINCIDSAINSTSEFISFNDFNIQISNPIKNYLITHPEIDFIVLTKGIPIKIFGAPNKPYGGDCTVDSLIASLDYNTNINSSIVDFILPENATFFTGQAYANKFWNSSIRFSHAEFGGYLVTRLDGYTQADAIALTTRSLEAEININNINNGKILLDACGSFGFDNNFTIPTSIFPTNYVAGQTIFITDDYQYSNFNSDILLAKNLLTAKGIQVQYDDNANFVGNISNLNGYVSWGSNDTNYDSNSYNTLAFIAGAIAETAVSTGARTFLQESNGQSLIASLISQGVTGVKGYAIEPLLLGVGSPSIMFDRYSSGWTLAESFYASAKLIGWMDIMIGDPICRAYANNLTIKNYETDNKFSVYPNPSSDFISINSNLISNIIVFNILGNKVLEIENYQQNNKIDVSKLENGIYFISINNIYNSKTLKFIKK